MRYRLPMLLPAVALGMCLAFVPACKKKDEGGGGGGGSGEPPVPLATGNAPDSVRSDFVLYAHLNAKDIRDSAIYSELKQAVTKAGGTKEWDMVEGQATASLGVKPTDIDSVTFCVTEIPRNGGPAFVLILRAAAKFDKAAVFGMRPGTKPDTTGFYSLGGIEKVHFPDDRTAVLIHRDLIPKYLEGYAKDRKGWPMSAELTKAAFGHTAFAVVQMDKLPAEMRNAGDMKEFGSLLAAKTVTLTADLKGKELSVAGRATFPDADAAKKAKEKAQELATMAAKEVEQVMNSKGMTEYPGIVPAVKEAHRMLKSARLEVSGSDATLVASYKADFDFGLMMVDAVKKIRAAAQRMKASNNYKQAVLALHNFASANQDNIPIQGVGAKPALIRNPNQKMLLSWRVAILPYIEEDNLYKQFKLDEPWDSEHNKKLIAKMPRIYAPVTKPVKPGETYMQMVVGPGAMKPGVAMLPTSFPDGTSNTIALVEAADPVIWTKPDDVMLPAKLAPGDLKKKFGGHHPGGFNVALWDGSVRFLPDSISEKTLGLAINPNDGQPLPSDW